MAESGEQSVGEAPVQPPSNAKDAVYAMLGSQLRTTLSDGRVVQGTLQCMDRLTNFILADAVETGTAPAEPTAGSGGRVNDVQDGDEGSVGNGADNADSSSTSSSAGQQPGAQQRHLGVVMIPGKHLVRVERLGGDVRPK
ncbi:unnamed protein product [Ectocarpus sp. 4 AP-2014]